VFEIVGELGVCIMFTQVHDVGCGYGFTVFLCSTDSGRMIAYGCGVNTDSQLGYQEFPPKSGECHVMLFVVLMLMAVFDFCLVLKIKFHFCVSFARC